MTRGNVDVALLSAWCGQEGFLITNDEVYDPVRRYPDRFCGVATVDIHDPFSAVAELRGYVNDLGFVAVSIVLWLWNLPPNDKLDYPIYTACVEMRVPFCTQIEHAGRLRRSEPGRPIAYLDDVLLDFPELIVIGGHLGFPWVGPHLSANPAQQGVLSTLEHVGRCLEDAQAAKDQLFNAASAILNYILGVAARMSHDARLHARSATRTEFLDYLASVWEELDPTDFRFLHSMSGSLRQHDDWGQFLAGLNFILSGIGVGD